MNKKKLRIYEEAARLFQEKGYAAASMRDLAARLNLQASSLYSHIRQKQEILVHICLENADHFSREMDRVEKSDAAPAEKVRELLKVHIRTALEDPTSITVFNDEWRNLEEPYLSDFLEKRRLYESRFRQLIQQAMQAREFKPVDAGVALNTLLSSVHWVHYAHRGDKAQTLVNTLPELILFGLYV